MTVTLYLAPAAAGKTAYLVAEACRLAHNLTATPRVVVPSRLQARAWRRRLAGAGGALGVRVSTFDDLWREILQASGDVVTYLTDPVQFRLLRALLDTAPLTHYAALRAAPGFVQVLRDLIAELKAGGVFPEDLMTAVAAMDGEPRLTELVSLYTAYQQRLQAEGWADYAGIGWLAEEALKSDPHLASDWDALLVDGFDDLTTVQIKVLQQLAARVKTVTLTLTGTAGDGERDLVHQRFNRTRQRLEAALGVSAQPLPAVDGITPPAEPLRHLERALFAGDHPCQSAEGAVTLIAAPDREAEVRAALRWLKARLVRDGLALHEMALLARSITPYRPFILQTAEEFGLPLHVVDGLPLRSNPAVAALLDLLQVALPGEGSLSWRLTVDAWRSPYFDWAEACVASDDPEPLAIRPADADALEGVARWGSVLGGMDQWEEAFDLLRAVEGDRELREGEGPEIPDRIPTGEDAARLWQRFRRFASRITPPAGALSCRSFVAWLEALIGDTEVIVEEEVAEHADGEPPLRTDLGIARRALEGPPALVARDLAALNALKDVLRGLVWAEEAVDCAPQTFAAFLEDLRGAVEAATYRLPLAPDKKAVLVADVTQARGLPFRAVAVVGLAEGEFPQVLTEDPFLRDADRIRLRDDFGLALNLSTASTEAEYAYETFTRPRDALLLTRPRIADNGAPWQPSPYWEEVRRRLDVVPTRLTSQSRPAPEEAASWPEMIETLSTQPADSAGWQWARAQRPADCAAVARARRILDRRSQDDPSYTGPYDGDLTRWGDAFGERFAPSHIWSASRLESYQTCPLFFFARHVLDLEPRQPPTEGLGGRQLGNIYHHIFEALYRRVGPDAELEALQAALPEIAAEILDAAPQQEQFRATAWWAQTRREIVENVDRSLTALEGRPADFSFYQAERTFGISGAPGGALTVRDESGDSFRLCGFIDRVDRAADDRDGQPRVRIIDYKTGGPSGYRDSDIREGRKLQLPLYALAAEEALGLGEVVDGFYWHVQHAKPSSFTLADFRVEERRGPRVAMETAVAHAWEAVRDARRGNFVPRAPDGGCPDYCPAASFCWHYTPRGW
jgi:ATP-dependent helicase/DNAse subunit B